MRFAWLDTVAALDAAEPDASGYFGTTITLPAPSMPTLTLKVSRWPAGWRSRPYRHTANTVYVVMQGEGRSHIGDAVFDWSFGDTMAAPAWNRIEHDARADSVVCGISDEALMRWAHYYRLEPLR